jgi:GYF domain 2
MEKIWYIILEGRKLGPFSVQDLKRDSRISPDTLVWKEGFEDWVPIKEVPELRAVFKDQDEEPEEEEEEGALPPEEELTLQMKEEPPSFLPLVILLTLCVMVYLLIKYYL